MCLNCGCGAVEDRHGRTGDITYSDLQRAAANDGQTPDEALATMVKTMAGRKRADTRVQETEGGRRRWWGLPTQG